MAHSTAMSSQQKIVQGLEILSLKTKEQAFSKYFSSNTILILMMLGKKH